MHTIETINEAFEIFIDVVKMNIIKRRLGVLLLGDIVNVYNQHKRVQ